MLIRIALFFAASVALLCGSVMANDVLPSPITGPTSGAVPFATPHTSGTMSVVAAPAEGCTITLGDPIQIDWSCIDRSAQTGDEFAKILKAIHEGRAVDPRAPPPTIASPSGSTYQCGSDASCRYGARK